LCRFIELYVGEGREEIEGRRRRETQRQEGKSGMEEARNKIKGKKKKKRHATFHSRILIT